MRRQQQRRILPPPRPHLPRVHYCDKCVRLPYQPGSPDWYDNLCGDCLDEIYEDDSWDDESIGREWEMICDDEDL